MALIKCKECGKEFSDMADYNAYIRKSDDGFVVLEKQISVICSHLYRSYIGTLYRSIRFICNLRF